MKKTYILEGLDCANCAAKIERSVSGIEGIDEASVNFLTTKMVIETEEVTDSMMKAIKKAVKKTDPDIIIKEV